MGFSIRGNGRHFGYPSSVQLALMYIRATASMLLTVNHKALPIVDDSELPGPKLQPSTLEPQDHVAQGSRESALCPDQHIPLILLVNNVLVMT